MVNLMLTGRAVSNTFDGDIVLEGEGRGGGSTTLKGIQKRSVVQQKSSQLTTAYQ